MTLSETCNGDPDFKNLTFERALSLLDETVQALEDGGLPLAEATRMFERGMKMAQVCSEMLAAAEMRITRIRTAFGEQMNLPNEPAGRGEPEPC